MDPLTLLMNTEQFLILTYLVTVGVTVSLSLATMLDALCERNWDNLRKGAGYGRFSLYLIVPALPGVVLGLVFVYSFA